MIRNFKYNQIPFPTLKLKRKIRTHTKMKKVHEDTHSKANEQLFPKQVVIQLPQRKTAATTFFKLFSILNYELEQNKNNNGQLLFI